MRLTTNLLLIITSLLLFSGCTATKTEVTSLGLLLPAPTSSFIDMNFGDGAEQQKYLEFKGTCLPRFTSLKFGYQKPTDNYTTDVNLSTFTNNFKYTPDKGTTFNNKTNDIVCSDGSYDFILSLVDIKAILGLTPDAVLGKNVLKSLSLTGVSSIGESYPLLIDVSLIGAADTQYKIGVRKKNPVAWLDSCEPLEVYLVDQHGKSVTRTSDTAFDIKQKLSNTLSNATIYSSSDCTSLSDAKILSNRAMTTVYYEYAKTISESQIEFQAVEKVQTNLTSENFFPVKLANSSTSGPTDAMNNVSAVSLGETHSCAIGSSGKLYCWGGNTYAQLGNNSTTLNSFPEKVYGTQTYARISSSNFHNCAIGAATGTVFCWGANNYGQSGFDPLAASGLLIPTATSFTNATALSVGGYHSCAIDNLSQLFCWGANQYGQIGDSSGVTKHIPTQVTSLSNVTAVTAGILHTCAITTGTPNNLYCWGNNSNFGQVGDGTMVNRLSPVSIALQNVIAVTTKNNHTCAITSANDLYCWGTNQYGQIGDGTATPRLLPTHVTGLSNVTAVATGGFHTCAITTDPITSSKKLYCWGRNLESQLGDGSTIQQTSPVEITGMTGITALTAGSFHTCAIVSNVLKCWGNDYYDQIAHKFVLDIDTPEKILAGRVYIASTGIKKDSYIDIPRAFSISNNPNFVFDTTLNCSVGTKSFANMTGSCTFNLKYTNTEKIGDSNNVLNFSSPAIGDGTNDFAVTKKIQIDTIGTDTITHFQIDGPNSATNNTCIRLTVTQLNANEAAVSSISTPQVVMATMSSDPTGSFHSGSTCDAASVLPSPANINITTGHYKGIIYYKSAIAYVTHRITATNLNGASSYIDITITP